jgi:hypothetical protein
MKMMIMVKRMRRMKMTTKMMTTILGAAVR